jgi:uncharacterized membrane-anchored protein
MNTHPDLNEPTTRGYLDRLTALAAETEDLAAATSYRFAATQAYSKLVERRLELMMETRLPSHEPISAYLARRLRPAVSTCEAVDRRIKDLAQRVARANDLLRTRVEVAQSAQSRDLLESMNTRAGLQLRLEQAVEVITVIAGTYYLASLVGFGAEALNVFGFTLDSGVVTGISAPAILIGLWAVIHRVQKAIKKAEGQH